MTETLIGSPVELFHRTLLLQGSAPGTARLQSRIIGQFLTDERVGDAYANQDAYVRWINLSRDTVAPATLYSRLCAGRAWFRSRGMDTDALDAYRMPPIPTSIPHPLPGGMDAVRAMLSAAEVEQNPSVVLCIALQGMAGLRVSEARSIDARKIDTVRRQIVVKGKGEKVRRIPISAELSAVIEAWAPETGPYVSLTDSGARKAITRIAANANVIGPDDTGVSSHDLRATFATAVYAKTKDILLVSRLLGHANVTTTQVYLGLDTESLKEAVEL